MRSDTKRVNFTVLKPKTHIFGQESIMAISISSMGKVQTSHNTRIMNYDSTRVSSCQN